MKLLISEKGFCKALFLCMALLALTLCSRIPLFAGNSAAAESEKTTSGTMIHITADRLLTNTQSQNAEFIGNVKVVRSSMSISSDRLKIFFTETVTSNGNTDPGAESISSIVAEGNVIITFDDQVATTQHAEWAPKDQTIVLSGPGSKIVSGKNSITGSTITVHMVDNRIKVEGGSGGRVEARFFSDEKGLTLPEKKQ